VAGVSGVVAAGLGGTGRLADDLYLMAHHDRSGKPLLQPRAAGLGLAGALLAELLLLGAIDIGPDGVVVTGPAPPAEELAGSVLDVLLRERQLYPLRDWLVFLARTSDGEVARRLLQSGYLMHAARPWRAGRWVPVDAECAFAPVARVQSVLRAPTRASGVEVTLAALADACGLGSRLWPYAPPQARRCLAEAVARLHPGLQEVIAQTQSAVDSAVLAHRT
jgi:hypothetical protein